MAARVSIGLPVYNGERFLGEALESLLGQTFGDFELIISDNASTDGTEEICRLVAAGDRRVRYFRADRNRGAAWNFNRVFELSGGRYFKWAACDDVVAPEFLARCVEALDADPSVVLCFCRAVDIDPEGRAGLEHRHAPRTGEPSAQRRFASLIRVNHACLAVFGLIRTEVLRATPLIGPYVASDRVLLAELGLRGRFHQVPEVLFFHREHPGRSTRAMPTLRCRAGWFDPGSDGRLVFPTWRLLAEYWRALRRAPLPGPERLLCLLQLLPWLRIHWRAMLGDLAFAVRRRLRPQTGPAVRALARP